MEKNRAIWSPCTVLLFSNVSGIWWFKFFPKMYEKILKHFNYPCNIPWQMPVVQPTKSIQQLMIKLDEKFLQFPIKTKIGDNSPKCFGGLSENEKKNIS